MWDNEGVTFGDAILASECPSESKDGISRFTISLHCVYIHIVARNKNANPHILHDTNDYNPTAEWCRDCSCVVDILVPEYEILFWEKTYESYSQRAMDFWNTAAGIY